MVFGSVQVEEKAQLAGMSGWRKAGEEWFRDDHGACYHKVTYLSRTVLGNGGESASVRRVKEGGGFWCVVKVIWG
jgi:hypothetical protein